MATTDACPICLDPAHSWDCSHASLMARVKALSDERDTLRAQLADYTRLHAELNRFLHPKGDGPSAPSLCDLVSFVHADLADRQRLLDLVRHQRGPLHDAELISDEEYAALAGDHGAVARLEGYDEVRVKLAEVEAALLNERGEGVPPEPGWAFRVTRDLQGVWGTEQNGGMVQRTTARGWYWTDYETGFSPKNVHPTARAAMRAANAARKG